MGPGNPFQTWALETAPPRLGPLVGQHTSLTAWVSLVAWERAVPVVFLDMKGQ